MSLGRKSRKSGGVVSAAQEAGKEYIFQKPKEGVVAPWSKPAAQAVTAPSSLPSGGNLTVAPTATGGIEDYMPFIIGGGVAIVGLGILWYLKKIKKI